ncbi:hypothetical protein C8E87_1970 [Paractinoplanes brasiliensis]|uniref:Uncharacterized protein n=1 Tax=Paractinoplanes brasiliensis TaxID=52695 RepID=A0A4V3C7N5_9ACTN|nr:hypothetical protein C8E87_1970 [Actinoplanes brasiliensis]
MTAKPSMGAMRKLTFTFPMLSNPLGAVASCHRSRLDLNKG